MYVWKGKESGTWPIFDWFAGWLIEYIWMNEWWNVCMHMNWWMNEWVSECLCMVMNAWMNEEIDDWLTDCVSEWVSDWLIEWLTCCCHREQSSSGCVCWSTIYLTDRWTTVYLSICLSWRKLLLRPVSEWMDGWMIDLSVSQSVSQTEVDHTYIHTYVPTHSLILATVCGLPGLTLTWPGLAWPGLALAWPGLAFFCFAMRIKLRG